MSCLLGVGDAERECPDIETASEGYARRFSGRAGQYFLKVQARAVRRLLSVGPQIRVLDVGGGHGQLIPIINETGADITVLGSADICHDRIRHSPLGVCARYVTGDLLHLPFHNQCYDTVLSVRLISHITDWKQLVAELCRVARRTIIIDYPSWRSLNALTPVLFRFKRLLEGNTRTYTNFCDRELVQEFGKHGFKPGDSERQFFLPMFIHRALDSPLVLQNIENYLRISRLTVLFGSPVIRRFDRAL